MWQPELWGEIRRRAKMTRAKPSLDFRALSWGSPVVRTGFVCSLMIGVREEWPLFQLQWCSSSSAMYRKTQLEKSFKHPRETLVRLVALAEGLCDTRVWFLCVPGLGSQPCRWPLVAALQRQILTIVSEPPLPWHCLGRPLLKNVET